MAGTDPPQRARGEVQFGDQRRHEAARERLLPGERRVDRDVGRRGTVPVAAAVAVRGERAAGHVGGEEPVAHRVEHGEVEHAAVERVVERVAANVITGLEQGRETKSSEASTSGGTSSQTSSLASVIGAVRRNNSKKSVYALLLTTSRAMKWA